MRQSPWALAALLTGLSFLRADGLVHRLPADGTFVRYDMESTMGERVRKIKLTVSSVGQETVDGKKCRWLEFKSTSTDPGAGGDMLTKLLIPEEQLKSGGSPLDHVVRGWIKEGGDPELQAWSDLAQESIDGFAPLLHGPIKDAKKLAKVAIDSTLGKLECEGVHGVALVMERGQRTTRYTVESRLHDKAPFGVVQVKMQIIHIPDGKVRGVTLVTIKLAEVGKNAKSELPEQK